MLNAYETSDEHRPVLWLSGYPVYAAHFIVLVYVVSMLVTTVVNLLNLGGLLQGLVFTSAQVLRGEVWRVVTYGLVNVPSLGFVIDMVMLVWFGREVERSFGRRSFLVFYAGVYLLTPLVLTPIGMSIPSSLAGETGAFAMFVAYATLFPEVPVFFSLLAKWVAMVLVGIYALIALNNRDTVALVSLVATTGFAFAYVRRHQGRLRLPRMRAFRGGPKLRVLPDLPPEKKTTVRRAEPPVSSMAEIDALLDKIAQQGMGSLSAKERAKLDAARTELLKRDQARR